jgi:hypothetical protein
MGKNINPKSLKGKDKLNRIKNLMGRMETLNESTSLSELDLVKKGPNGVVYGIVRENHKYFIKTTDKSSGNLLAEDFDYIGGLQNKFSEAYDSYAEATKQLNLKFDMLNESFGVETNNNILESDGVAFGGGAGFGFVVENETCEQCGKEICECSEGEEEIIADEVDEIEEQQKVLKVDAPAAPAEPAMEEPMEDEVPDEMGMEDPMADAGMEEPMEEPAMDDEGDDEDNPTKKIQKMTGKIGQMMRDMDEPDVDLEKYVINSVISAMHLDLFSDEDVEDIISKLEGEDEEDDMAADDMGGEDLGMEEPSMEEEPALEEPAMEEPELAEESFKITKGDLVESLTKKILKDRLDEDFSYETKTKLSPKRKRGMTKARNTARKKYTSKQMRTFDKDGDGVPFEKEDMKMLRKSKRNEGWDLMDDNLSEDFDMMSSDYVDCPQCEGMGCPHCEGMGYHLSNEFDGGDFDEYGELDIDFYTDDIEDSEPTTKRLGHDGIDDDFMTINGRTGEYGPFDRDGDEIDNENDLDDDGDGRLDEFDGDGYGMDVMDSISADFDKDFDEDGDGLPKDIDNTYGDGEKSLSRGSDLDYGDIQFYKTRGNAPTREKRPVKTPDRTKTPKKKPGNPMWNPKPAVSPDPKAVGKDGVKTESKKSFRKRGYYK